MFWDVSTDIGDDGVTLDLPLKEGAEEVWKHVLPPTYQKEIESALTASVRSAPEVPRDYHGAEL